LNIVFICFLMPVTSSLSPGKAYAFIACCSGSSFSSSACDRAQPCCWRRSGAVWISSRACSHGSSKCKQAGMNTLKCARRHPEIMSLGGRLTSATKDCLTACERQPTNCPCMLQKPKCGPLGLGPSTP
jgi:hypothetical protein